MGGVQCPLSLIPGLNDDFERFANWFFCSGDANFMFQRGAWIPRRRMPPCLSLWSLVNTRPNATYRASSHSRCNRLIYSDIQSPDPHDGATSLDRELAILPQVSKGTSQGVLCMFLKRNVCRMGTPHIGSHAITWIDCTTESCVVCFRKEDTRFPSHRPHPWELINSYVTLPISEIPRPDRCGEAKPF